MTDNGATGSTVLERRLKADLRQAMRDRDPTSVAALRVAVAALDNAGSSGIPMEDRAPASDEASDVPRKELTEEEAVGIVRREAEELLAGVSAAESAGSAERATELRTRHAILASYIEA